MSKNLKFHLKKKTQNISSACWISAQLDFYMFHHFLQEHRELQPVRCWCTLQYLVSYCPRNKTAQECLRGKTILLDSANSINIKAVLWWYIVFFELILNRYKQIHCQCTAYALLRSMYFQIFVSWAASQPPAMLGIFASGVLLCSKEVRRIPRDPWDSARTSEKRNLERISGCRVLVSQNRMYGAPTPSPATAHWAIH